jgi:hypothetical protein
MLIKVKEFNYEDLRNPKSRYIPVLDIYRFEDYEEDFHTPSDILPETRCMINNDRWVIDKSKNITQKIEDIIPDSVICLTTRVKYTDSFGKWRKVYLTKWHIKEVDKACIDTIKCLFGTDGLDRMDVTGFGSIVNGEMYKETPAEIEAMM